MKKPIQMLVSFVGFIMFCSPSLWALAQTATASPTLEHRLRQLYYRDDTNLVVLEGQSLVGQPNVSLQARAWYFTQGIDHGDFTPFLPLASVLDSMQKDAPDDPWTLVARAFAAGDLTGAAALCEKAVAASSNPDVLVLCLQAMTGKGQTGSNNELTEFLERHRSRIDASADALVAKADALEWLGSRPGGRDDRQQRVALYDRALTLDPHNTRALVRKVTDLFFFMKRTNEAAELVTQGLKWANESVMLHAVYWHVIEAQDLSNEEKGRRIEADAVSLLRQTALDAWNASSLLDLLNQYSGARAEAVGDLILQRYPDGPAADHVLVDRATAALRSYGEGVQIPDRIRQQVVRDLIAFLRRPRHHSQYAGNIAHGILRDLLINKPSPDAYTEHPLAVAKAGRRDIAPTFAVEVLNRKAHIAEIKQLAATRIDEILREAKDRTGEWQLPGLTRRETGSFGHSLSVWYDVLGWAELQEGRLEEAGTHLITAEKLDDRGFNLNLFLHLGKLSEAKKDFAKAESYYARALATSTLIEGEHPAIAAYRGLYLRQHGNTDGLEDYLAAVYEKDRARRKTRVLAGRIKSPEPVPPFNPKTLDGQSVSSSDLKGKIVVINFWATWCGPCKKEMPEFQQLYDTYRHDPQVAILTIDADDTVEPVKQYMEKTKYTFPVLLPGEYLAAANIGAFPTTWFLDRDGKKAFEKIGGTPDLEAEFSWRIEALRADANAKAAANSATQ